MTTATPPGLLHMDKPLRAFYQFFLDLIIFTLKSAFYLLETLYYTMLPERFRKLKVRKSKSFVVSKAPENTNLNSYKIKWVSYDVNSGDF